MEEFGSKLEATGVAVGGFIGADTADYKLAPMLLELFANDQYHSSLSPTSICDVLCAVCEAG